MAKPLSGLVCLVTGATRGIGKGIALQLGEAGATVYVTGRTLRKTEKSLGSLEETVEEINGRGGRGVAVQVDHTKDNEIERLFEKIKAEQNGQLDLLVNNAYSGVNSLIDVATKPFWEQPISIWDDINIVGLRNHYICSVHAARMMVPRKSGLIVIVSSGGGLVYTFNAAYGIGKEACDRMAADLAHELKKHGVACVSLWPGYVQTETLMSLYSSADTSDIPEGYDQIKEGLPNGESTEFSGKCIVKIMCDKANLMKKSGRILPTGDLADEYSLVDIDGRKPACMRSLKFLATHFLRISRSKADWIPGFLKIPSWLVYMMGYKF
ncbi:dehydrogenase/reductase SDR family member 1 [Octopus sinensis]|uniref:Dehydrogenase/reductase SDR family member 1 n=1 Tax=Octopus sinensis TaxID=2607531 RepID=A0A6P7TH03_9MOLL|nr:dehydrogenase/reductase SDR family member 1 [Octopus sinensis]